MDTAAKLGITAAPGSSVRRLRDMLPQAGYGQGDVVATPLRMRGVDLYPSIGIYTIDGHAAGAYGRIAERPLIDGRARDTAVLVTAGPNDPNDSNVTNDPNESPCWRE